MAVTRRVEFDGVMSVELEGTEFDGVHFTDEEFDIMLVVRNLADERLTGTVELGSYTESNLGLGRDPLARWTVAVDLGPGEVHREPIPGVGMVGGAGTGLIGVVYGPEVVESGDGRTVIEPDGVPRPVLSVVLWDRDFYRANYLWPRRAQYLSVVFALLSAVLAGAIVWLTI